MQSVRADTAMVNTLPQAVLVGDGGTAALLRCTIDATELAVYPDWGPSAAVTAIADGAVRLENTAISGTAEPLRDVVAREPAGAVYVDVVAGVPAADATGEGTVAPLAQAPAGTFLAEDDAEFVALQQVCGLTRLSGFLVSGVLVSGFLVSGFLVSGSLVSGSLVSGFLVSGFLVSGVLVRSFLSGVGRPAAAPPSRHLFMHRLRFGRLRHVGREHVVCEQQSVNAREGGPSVLFQAPFHESHALRVFAAPPRIAGDLPPRLIHRSVLRPSPRSTPIARFCWKSQHSTPIAAFYTHRGILHPSPAFAGSRRAAAHCRRGVFRAESRHR